ncbi:class I glutamine amidotransferase-like protein [Podospora conica]|nr:class I glutamine amidotransferase-like protein [Schizothecium conicum]
MAPSVLIVLTSHSKLGDTGQPTGWFLPELSHPYNVFAAHNYNITLASPLGGVAPLDPSSVDFSKDDPSALEFHRTKSALWESTRPLSEFAGGRGARDYDALFFCGGHGPVFDLATDPTSQAITAEFAAAGKVVSAVCHGPAALVGVKGEGGKFLLEGKEVTGFSNEEEEMVGKTEVVPFLLESRIKEIGGKYVKADSAWGEKVVVDGRLVTGQNPASAKGVGEAVVKLVGEKQ